MEEKGVFDKLKGKGEEVFTQISNEVISNPLFIKAFEKALKAKKRLDRTATTAMGAMNLPTTKDIHHINKRLDAIESKLDELLAAAKPRRRSKQTE